MLNATLARHKQETKRFIVNLYQTKIKIDMCLYPKLMLNKKYLPTRKNNYNPPICTDERVKYIAVGCGNCIECRKQKARAWQVRLNEEIKSHAHAYFVTLTFSEQELAKICGETKLDESNAVASVAVRRFLERWRKKHKKSLKHWLITELGHQNTERIHLHGIIFSEECISNEKLQGYWQYGKTDIGQYCNERTINYIIKYVTKLDTDHKGYQAQIFTSAGIGSNFIQRIKDAEQDTYKYNKGKTIEYYRLRNGQKVNLPIYYRNKLFTEAEREQLWIDKIEQNHIFVRGIEVKNINSSKGQKTYFRILEQQQKENTALGYGDDSKDWQKKVYKAALKRIKLKEKQKK